MGPFKRGSKKRNEVHNPGSQNRNWFEMSTKGAIEPALGGERLVLSGVGTREDNFTFHLVKTLDIVNTLRPAKGAENSWGTMKWIAIRGTNSSVLDWGWKLGGEGLGWGTIRKSLITSGRDLGSAQKCHKGKKRQPCVTEAKL